MITKIKILIAEHDLNDLEIIETELRRGGIDFEREVVQNESCYRKSLKKFIPDVILSDYTFPSFDGHAAFTIREQLAPHTPFILVSGTIGEVNSIELIKNGVTDFVLKDKLFTLVPKVNRALRDLIAWKKKEEIQKQLVLRESQLAEAQAIAKVGSWVTDLSDLNAKWSRETFRIYGLEEHPGTVSHAELLEIVHPQDRVYVETAFKNSFPTSSVNTIKHRIITSSGELKFVEKNWKVIRDKRGIPLQAMGSCQDITERIKGEEQKEFERREKEALINSTDDIMWSVSNDLKLIAVNKAYIKAIELTTGKMVRPGDDALMPGYFPDSVVQYWTNLYEKALAGNSFKENVHIPGTGSSPEIWIETSFNAIYQDGIVTGCACFSRDITETKKSEASILKAYEEKNTVLESIDDGFFATDKNLVVNYWNSKAEILLGVKKENIVGKNLHETFADSSSPVFYDNFQKALRENSTIRFEGFYNRTKKWFAVSAFASDNGLSVYFKDVTEQKNNEEKLKESENRFRAIIEKSSELITLTTEEGKILYISPSITQTFGYTFKDVGSKILFSYFHPDDINEFQVNRKKILENPGYLVNYQIRVLHKNGHWVWCECTLANMLEEPGVQALVKNFRDITEKKKAEDKIKESEAKYRAFFESSMDGILLTVTDGEILSANPAACEIFKMTEDEICAAGRFDIFDLSDPRLLSLIEERQRTGKAKGELTLHHKDGSKFEAELTSAVFTDSYGLDRTSMIVRDISERKAAEFELKQTTKELQHTLNDLNKIMVSSMDIICTVDNEGNFMQVSAASQAIWGYSPQELISSNYTAFVCADDLEKTAAQTIEVKNGLSITMFENRFVHKNGSIVPMLWSAKWDEDDQLIYCIGKDATEKKRLERENEIERQRFLGLYLQAPSSMGILKGPNHVFEIANPPYLQLTNKPDLIGKTVKEVFPEVESQGFIELLDTVYKTGNTFSANEMLIKIDREGNGELVEIYLNFMYQAHRDNQNKINGILFFAIDVTEQVLSRKKIEESEKEIRSMAESMPQIVWVTNAQGENTYFNQQWMDYTGFTLEESYGTGWIKPFHQDDKTLALEAWKNAVKTLTEYVIECRLKCYDGSYRWWLIRGVPKINDNGEILKWYGTCTEIENIKQTEEKLKKQATDLVLSNLELEQFAYVASHDLQEPLRMITSFLSRLEKKYGTVLDEKGKQYIHFAVDGAKRMRQIILDLLDFSKVGRTEDKQEVINLNELVDEIKILFRNKIEEKKAIIISGNLPCVPGFRSPLRQVFYNLFSNALKFVCQDQPSQININCTEFNDHWQFAVRDNGIGIEQEYLDKIFIIFQRLHNSDEYSGTGMGLAITKKIIENQGGKIWVESAEGKGSTFYFTIQKN